MGFLEGSEGPVYMGMQPGPMSPARGLAQARSGSVARRPGMTRPEEQAVPGPHPRHVDRHGMARSPTVGPVLARLPSPPHHSPPPLSDSPLHLAQPTSPPCCTPRSI